MAERPSPVRLVVPEHPNVPMGVRQRLQAERQRMLEDMIQIDEINDLAEIRDKIRGIDIALRICAEVEQALDER